MKSLINKLVVKYKQYGLFQTLYLVLLKLTGKVLYIRKEIIADIDITTISSIRKEAQIPIITKIVNDTKFKKLLKLVDKDKGQIFRTRMKEKKKCIISKNNEDIVSYGWITFTDEFESNTGITIKVGNNESYIFDCFTFPNYRNKGIYTAMLSEMLEILKKDYECKKVFIAVRETNIPAKNAMFKIGFKECIKYTSVQFIGWSYIYKKHIS